MNKDTETSDGDSTSISEGFFWENKESFENKRQSFIDKEKEGVVLELSEVEFIQCEHLTTEELDTCATIFLRSEYVGRYMLEKMRREAAFVKRLGYTFDEEDIDFKGFCEPVFLYNSQELSIRQISNIPANETSNVTVKDIKIAINMRSLVADVKDKFELYSDYIEGQPDKIEKANLVLQRMIEKLAIEYERIMVEEVAHGLYYSQLIRHPQSIIRICNDLRNYPDFSINDVSTDEDKRKKYKAYLNNPIERRARIWVRSYLRKYYPNSSLLVEELKYNKFRLER